MNNFSTQMILNLPVHRLNDDTGDLIGVGVGSGPAVLKVSLALEIGQCRHQKLQFMAN
jgi:hypothetical protein